MDLYDIKVELLNQCSKYKQSSRDVTVSVPGVPPSKILTALDQLEADGKIKYRYSGTTYIDGTILLEYLYLVPRN